MLTAVIARKAYLVLFALVLLVSACGEEVESEGATEGTVKIGLVLPLTDVGASVGEDMLAGAQVAADQINSGGGAGGYRIELVAEDHQNGDTSLGLSAARKLISQDNASVILSSYSGVTLAVQSVAVGADMLVFNGGGNSPELLNKPNLYNTRSLGSQLAPIALEYVFPSTGPRLATIRWNDVSGDTTEEAATEKWRELGGEVVASESYSPGLTDYRSFLSKIKARNPDVIGIWAYQEDVGYIIKQARDLGIDADFVGLDFIPNAQEIAGEAADGYIVALDTFDINSSDPIAAEFVEEFRAANDRDPDFFAANYYDLTKIVGALVEQAVEDGADPTNPASLMEAFNEIPEFESVYGGSLQFREDGSVSKPHALFKYEDGQLLQIQ